MKDKHEKHQHPAVCKCYLSTLTGILYFILRTTLKDFPLPEKQQYGIFAT